MLHPNEIVETLILNYWNSPENSDEEKTAKRKLTLAYTMPDIVSTEKHGVHRSQSGDNTVLAFSMPELKVLDRSQSSPKRNQAFSTNLTDFRVSEVRKVTLKSGKTVTVSKYVDPSLLRFHSDSEKLEKAATYKRQNARRPQDALGKIEAKIAELVSKLEKAINQGKDTTALDALLLRCNYYRHREIVRLDELDDKAELKAEIGLVGQLETGLPTNVGHINRSGRTIPNGGINVPVDKLVTLGDKPIVPASVGKRYKVKRKVLADKPRLHGAVSRKARRAGATTASERKALGIKSRKAK